MNLANSITLSAPATKSTRLRNAPRVQRMETGDALLFEAPPISKLPAARPHLTITGSHWLAHDENGSHLVNFPFALIAFTTLGSGLLLVCCGMVIPSAWLAALGCFLMLVGGGMYGWSLYDE